jgi:acetyltransferase-like isoleucine patch superfamily enzyme
MSDQDRLQPVLSQMGNALYLGGGHRLVVLAKQISIGENVWLSPDLEIGLPDKWLDEFRVGDNARIYSGQIASRRFIAGDYLTIHDGVWAYGHNDIVIGHNCWFGRRCTLDAEGGFRVGNGFGAGQDTHMWSHIRHGDVMIGNRWLKYGEFRAGDDVWLTGRCTSAPAEHGDRSMAMVESNLTKGMPENTVWGGNPARDLTDKLGPPFGDKNIVERHEIFNEYVDRFSHQSGVEFWDADQLRIRFDPETRTYVKMDTEVERRFMRFLLPEVKFVPRGEERVE